MKNLFIFLLIFSLCTLTGFRLNATMDTIPVSRTSKGIRNNLALVYKGSLQRAKYLSTYSVNDFTRNQLDSFLLALNDDNLVNPYLILSAGLWQLDREDVHQRLCSFITLDTLDYSGKWGENRRPRFNKNEWAARLALARLGYPYHVDFIESIFQEQSISHNNKSGKLTLYTSYINKNQITNFLLDLALKDHFYAFIDYENHEFEDTTTYYLSQVIMFSLPIVVEGRIGYTRKRWSDITDNDISQFKQWIRNSKRKNITLKEDS